MQNYYPHRWRAFVGIALLSFGCYLDYTIVNVALPTIQRELQSDLTTLQWVMNIYFLALCILATIMGRCGDLYGRRRVFYIGVVIFTLASILAGLAADIYQLIAGRLLQGIGAAVVLPLGPSLLPECFPKHERSKVIAWFGSLGGIALAVGPVLGGVIVSYIGWRWIFFINVPILIIGYLFCQNVVNESVIDHQQRDLDWQGTVLLALTMSGLVLGLIRSGAHGWYDVITLSYLIVGIFAGVCLVKVEGKKTNPLIDFKDFSNLMFYAGAVLVFLAGAFSAVALFFDPIYLQIIREQSPQMSGLVLFMIPIAVFVGALIVGGIVHRLGIINTIMIGLSIAIVAGLLQIFFTSNSALGYIIFSFICLGLMWAMGNTVPLIAAQTAVGPARASVATGTMVTMFNMGGSIGLTVAVVLYHVVSIKTLQHFFQQHAHMTAKNLEYLTQFIVNPAHALQMFQLSDVMHLLFNAAFMHGFAAAMWFLLILSCVGLVSVVGWRIVALNTQRT